MIQELTTQAKRLLSEAGMSYKLSTTPQTGRQIIELKHDVSGLCLHRTYTKNFSKRLIKPTIQKLAGAVEVYQESHKSTQVIDNCLEHLNKFLGLLQDLKTKADNGEIWAQHEVAKIEESWSQAKEEVSK